MWQLQYYQLMQLLHMEGLSIIVVICLGVGIVVGMYVSSQIDNNSELKKNLNKFDETHRKISGNKKD